MRVRITQIDGKLPNLALMRLSAWHRDQGDDVQWRHEIVPDCFENAGYDVVYASAMFGDDPDTQEKVRLFRSQWPTALVGGEGGDKDLRVEHIVRTQFRGLDYSAFPKFQASIGYAMRGCRFKCGFCPVPGLEGGPRSVATVDEIWRGPGFPKQIHLLDNDFFGNPKWPAVVQDLNVGGFDVCISQGINVRLLADKQRNADREAAQLATLRLRDDQFQKKRLWTAWDNVGHERVFFQGVDRLERHGFRPDTIFVYMLIGWDKRETWERLFYRFNRMRERGVRPYPMVYAPRNRTLPPGDLTKLCLADRLSVQAAVRRRLTIAHFQSWVLTFARGPFGDFDLSHKAPDPDGELLALMAAA